MSSDVTERLREYKERVREDKQEALKDDDEEGATYAAGKEAGLIAAIEAIEEADHDV